MATYRITSKRANFRQDISDGTTDILTHVRKVFGADVKMPALPGKSGDIIRARRGRKVVATVALLAD